MCGIAGIYTFSLPKNIVVRHMDSMIGTLVHRGPDYKGTWTDGRGIYLGHTRLSIIDLSDNANQPMISKAGRTSIVFNGEIYNYVEEKQQLKSEGVSFKSESDTEVILALYEKYGLEFINRLRGMFAFGLWDNEKKRLILVRDRVGKKPLYYTNIKGSFYFASEIKAIQAIIPSSSLAINMEALDEYLSFGFISGERTIYKNIHELMPGSMLITDGSEHYTIKRYWEPQWIPNEAIDHDDALEETDRILADAVRLRLRSDVPVGIFLSGGIDSGLITALAAKSGSGRCHTFSVGFSDDQFDERPLARSVAKQYGTEHHEILIKPEVESLLPRIVEAYDEPFADPSAVPSFMIAEYACRYVKVVLNGDGGDELFAGYRRHLATVILDKLEKIHLAALVKMLGGNLLKVLPVPRSHRTVYAFSHRFLRGVASSNLERCLIWFGDGFSSEEKKALYSEAPPADSGMEGIEKILERLSDLTHLNRTIAMDFSWSLPFDLLVKMDIATMAHGLEARSPFLDHQLVEWANKLPQRVKFPGTTTKPILRNLAERYLPGKVCNAPKKGFEIPLYKWLNHDLKEICHDTTLASGGIIRSLFKKEYLNNLLGNKIPMEPGRWSVHVWTLLMLGLWEKHCYKS